jgi:hypothetical protein
MIRHMTRWVHKGVVAMEKWKAVALTIRCLVVANLALIAGVLLLHSSRPTAIKVFWAFRASALALLLFVPMEYILRRARGAKWHGLILDALLAVLMFGVWFTISAASF